MTVRDGWSYEASTDVEPTVLACMETARALEVGEPFTTPNGPLVIITYAEGSHGDSQTIYVVRVYPNRRKSQVRSASLAKRSAAEEQLRQ
jgi:hypothetical protein